MACSVVPDEVALEYGHSFNDGRHIEGTWNPEGLRNNGNGDSDYVGVSFVYKIKPERTYVTNWDEFKPPANNVELVSPPKTEPLPPNEDLNIVEEHLDTAERVIDIVEDTSWGVWGRIYLALGVLLIGGFAYWWLVMRGRK